MSTVGSTGERQGAWDPLFGGAGPSVGVGRAWLEGLGFNGAAPPEVLISLLDTQELSFLYRRDLPVEVLDAVVAHPSKNVWGRAAEAGTLSVAQWGRLLSATAHLRIHAVLAEMAEEQAARAAKSPSVGRIGIEAAPSPESRPPSTPAEIATMAAGVPEISADRRTYALWWVAALHDDPDAMRQLASSSKLWIRRSVARAPRLPADVVRLLARDEDRVVRLFLSESCDDAPGELLLEVWSWWSGSYSFPGRPRNHPNFPRQGLVRLADDPEPRIRLLALDDPRAGDALVERFSRDPVPDVRGRAAEHARLSAESAVRLAGDADLGVRSLARRHAALPSATVVRLLLDELSAGDAARNPSIPVAVMRRMIGVVARLGSG